MAWLSAGNRCASALAFALAHVACGPSIAIDGDEEGSTEGPSTDATTTAMTTVGTLTTTPTTGETDYDTYDSYDTYDTYYDDTCDLDPHTSVFDVPRSTLERWLDENGAIAPEDCWAACDAAGIWDAWIIDCEVVGGEPDDDPGGSTTSDDTTTTGGTGDDSTAGDTDSDGEEPDPIIELECTYEYYCGG